MKRYGKILLGIMLWMVMMLGCVFTARADKTISGLGTGSIENPIQGAGGWSKVYFGSKEDPILFNVLQKKETVFSSEEKPTMLLDCAYNLANKRFSSNDSNTDWSSSEIRNWLNGDFKGSRFTTAEISAIAASSKSEKGPRDGNGYYYQYYDEDYGTVTSTLWWKALNGESIFLLDAAEATNTSYGFADTDETSDTRIKKYGNTKTSWWLRSPGSRWGVGFVYSSGSLSYDPDISWMTYGVSPALNVDLSHVIFSSLISANSSIYKLTIRDAARTIAIQSGESIKRESATQISVPYIMDSGSDHMSLLITNAKNDSGQEITWTDSTGWSNGAVKQYYKTVAEVSSSGTITFSLPDNYESNRDNWKVWILAEQLNRTKETDYASEPLCITIPHWHSYTYNASGASITATCTSGCPEGYDSQGIRLTLKAAEELDYNGSVKTVVIEDNYPATVPEGLAPKPTTISYYKSTGVGSTVTSGSELPGAPSGAGNYAAQITWGNQTASLAFTIMPITICSVEVTINEPVANANFAAFANTMTDHVTLDTVTWMPSSSLAAYSTVYTATVKTTADVNYAFADNVTSTVNGKKAAVKRNNDGTLSISYTFDRTAPEDKKDTGDQKAEDKEAEGKKAEDKVAEGKKAEDKVAEGKKAEDKEAEDKKKAADQEKTTIAKTPASVKAKVKKNKVTVSWKKIKKNKAGKKLLKQIKSIQVQYSTDPSFKDAVTKKVGKKKTKIKLKLQRKTTYYVRVRYVGADGVSRWSKVKRVKTK